VRWQVQTVTVVFPRRRHLQHQRGEGRNQLARNGSETALTNEGGCNGGSSKSVAPGGGFLAVRWRNGKGGVRGRQ
jgi:hypothetical protein